MGIHKTRRCYRIVPDSSEKGSTGRRGIGAWTCTGEYTLRCAGGVGDGTMVRRVAYRSSFAGDCGCRNMAMWRGSVGVVATSFVLGNSRNSVFARTGFSASGLAGLSFAFWLLLLPTRTSCARCPPLMLCCRASDNLTDAAASRRRSASMEGRRWAAGGLLPPTIATLSASEPSGEMGKMGSCPSGPGIERGRALYDMAGCLVSGGGGSFRFTSGIKLLLKVGDRLWLMADEAMNI